MARLSIFGFQSREFIYYILLLVYHETIDMFPAVQEQISLPFRKMDFDDDVQGQLHRLVKVSHFQLNCRNTH